MNVLAIEAGGAQIGLAAVKIEDAISQVLATFSSDEPRSLSRESATAVDKVLARASWNLADVDTIAVGIGPGSWTSLRIALATAKTLAQIEKKNLCGILTFEAWARAVAQNLTENSLICTTERCRPGEIYGKIFEFEYSNSDLRALTTEKVDAPENWAKQIAALNKANWPIFVCGEMAESVTLQLRHQNASGQNASGTNVSTISVSMEDVAIAVAQLGAEKSARGENDDALTLQPLYIGVSNAERTLQNASKPTEQTSTR